MSIIYHISKDMEHDREVIERITGKNVEGKLSAYLKKYSPEDIKIELFIEGQRHQFNGKVHANLGGEIHHFSRESYKNLDDLINNLFQHLKEALSAE